MADPKLVQYLKQGSGVWNRWRELQPENVEINLSYADLSYANLGAVNLSHVDLRNTDLSYANLSDADLSGADLSDADLSYANLSEANLSEVNLRNANLRNADLSYANLYGVNLYEAELSEANLYETELIDANLSHAHLRRANLQGASIRATAFAHIDLREVKGLTEIRHYGPSLIELYTIQLPQDGSALHFLRGTGVPDEWIAFYQSTMMHPIRYHSLFISYSSKDDTLARRLHADLQAQGVRCWFAPEDMKIGDKIRTRIDEAIHVQDKLLLLLSEHALSSRWVEDEVEAALEKESRQQREVLFPVRLDDSVMQTSQAWAATLRRSRYIGDFSNWTNPDLYEEALNKLLRDLKVQK